MRIAAKMAAVLVTVGMTGLAMATPAAAMPGIPTIGLGAHGEGVWCTQHAINLHYGKGKVAEDSSFGSQTQFWVKAIQIENNLPVTGRVDARTGEKVMGSIYNEWTNWLDCYGVVPTLT